MARTHTIVVEGIPQLLLDKTKLNNRLQFNKHTQTYHCDYEDFLHTISPNYHVNRRKEKDTLGKTWYVCWWDGKDHRRSTGLTDFSLAREKAKEMWKEIFYERFGREQTPVEEFQVEPPEKAKPFLKKRLPYNIVAQARDGIFMIYYYDKDGKRERKSLKTKDKDVATENAERYWKRYGVVEL